MAKLYYITESQYKELLSRKKEEKKVFNQICEELANKRKTLTEGTQLNEGILDTVKSYVRKGLMTTALIASLLAANQVTAQQLMQAGVPKDKIEMATQGKEQGGDEKVPLDKIEKQILQVMRRNDLKGTLARYNKLTPEQKQKVLMGIQSKVKNIEDINHISVGDWEKSVRGGDTAFQFDQKTDQVIKVVTVDTLSTIPVGRNFAMNSFTLQNPDSLRDQLKELIVGYQQIDSVVIESSSSTLRNKGEAEGMTWKQLSQKRAEEVAKVLTGMEIDLGGEGVNKVGVISGDMIKINSDGTNGDGTSGNKSPYEVNPEYVRAYQERGLDPSLWQSAAKEDALPEEQLDAYEQFQYVNVKVYGRTVVTETEEVPSFRYVTIIVQKYKGQIKRGTNEKENDVSKCPVKVYKKNVIPQGSVLQGMRK